MQQKYTISLLVFALSVFLSEAAFSQKKGSTDTAVIAGSEYKSSSFHRWLWGSNYRNEWTTPVRVSSMQLDTAEGGLLAYKAGGGHQTKSLHLKTSGDKEYALRSVNKSLSKVLPESFRHTFIENIANDEISMSHPYGAVSVIMMEEAAGIYHTYPQYIFLPKQPALDSFNKKFGNNLYLFEQRLDGDWSDADNLGNFKKFYSTDEILDKIYKDTDHSIDQKAFVKARLFDMFIGDWDRHEDQWAWGTRDTGNKKKYEPIPQDRDQAYFKYNGLLLSLVISAADLHYLQSFKSKMANVKTFNYEERNLDRFFTNQMTLADWQQAAGALQQSLTDSVIERSVQQLPPEIFAISGEEIVAKLKARRSYLTEMATVYYHFLAKAVDITGSEKNEHFEIRRLNEEQIAVNLFKNKEINESPFYSRIFDVNETKEIRLYGLSGEDIYHIEGNARNKMIVRIIGGDDKDSLLDNSVNSVPGSIRVYDDKHNFFPSSAGTRFHLSADTSIHEFTYSSYLYDKRGLKPSVLYSNEDRIYVGLGYQVVHHKWRKEPFASKQLLDVHYSISQKAFSVGYIALLPHFSGKWDLALKANYDAVRWTNFFGLGNETAFTIDDINYYRMRTEEWTVSPEGIRKFGMNTIKAGSFFQSVRIINDTGRFVPKTFTASAPLTFENKKFAGGYLNYSFHQLNDSVVPTKGFIFSANALFSRNLEQTKRSIAQYSANIEAYIPLFSKFSLALKTGGATVKGNPELYQYASIGGPSLRGFRRDRFWGRTAFYNTNDLRYITKIRTHVFNGEAGLIGFVDNGRVWMPGALSHIWHTGYGAGIMLAPFNKISANITYGISPEEKILQVRINKYF